MPVGRPGTVSGVVPLDTAEKPLVPIALMAATWKKYVVPLINPVTEHAAVVDVVTQPIALLNGPLALVPS